MASVDPTLISSIVNLILVILGVFLTKHNKDLTNTLNLTNKKLRDLQVLVTDFITAYQDKYISKDEAQKLIQDVKRLVEDP